MEYYEVGDLVYRDKYHRGLLEIVEVHDWYVVVGKHSRVGIRKSMIRRPTEKELEKHIEFINNWREV